MMQQRPDASQAFYSPARDIAYLLPQTADQALAVMLERKDPELSAWLDDCRVSPADMEQAWECFCRLIETVHSTEAITIPQAMRSSGFPNCPFPIRMALLQGIGAAVVVSFLHSAPIAYGGGDVREAKEFEHVLTYLRELTRQFSAPWYRRWWLWIRSALGIRSSRYRAHFRRVY